MASNDVETTQSQLRAEEPSVVEEENHVGETVVVIAGRPSSGKSRALNNIFGVKFESKNSVHSVTNDIEYKRVTKKGSTVIVVDTPGLGAADIEMNKVKDDFASVIGDLNCTLLYCHSVGPNNKLMDVDVRIFKNLQKVLGKKIWKRCIILFTFSDTLRREDYPKYDDNQAYLRYLQEHVTNLEEKLKKHCGDHVPNVKLVSDVVIGDAEIEDIVAIPVGKMVTQKQEAEVLIPAPDGSGRNWWMVAWNVIEKKSTKLDRIVLKKVLDSKAQTVAGLAASVVVGSALGGLGGVLVGGVAAAGVGAIPGAFAGAVMGGLAAGLGGGGLGQVILAPHVEATKRKIKADNLRSAEFVETSNAEGQACQQEVVRREELDGNSYASSSAQLTQSLASDDPRKRLLQQKKKERPVNRIHHLYSKPSSPSESPQVEIVDSEVPDDDESRRPIGRKKL